MTRRKWLGVPLLVATLGMANAVQAALAVRPAAFTVSDAGMWEADETAPLFYVGTGLLLFGIIHPRRRDKDAG